MAMVEEKQYAVDQEKLKEYFPMEVVIDESENIHNKIIYRDDVQRNSMP